MQNKLKLCIHWIRMLSGKSYYHAPQGLGKAFERDTLAGYFNDMTAKTYWKGLKDSDGIPINQMIDGTTCYFATTIIQKALGHHDHFILSRDKKQFDEFIRICDWLVNMQDKAGGWDVKAIMSLEGELKYSAMPQGEAISALVRAWRHTGETRYLEASIKAYELLLLPVEEGGTSFYKQGEMYLEEYPAKAKNTVLNGWIFALFGIYDLFLATGNEGYLRVFNRSFLTLKNQLPRFDAGFWSFYNERKSLASPFYHDLHISQLEALGLVTSDVDVKVCILKWIRYKRNPIKKYYAFGLKAYQKLRKPALVVIVK